MSVLVLGATGGQGSAVTDELLAAGRSVRAMLRDPRSRRATLLAARGVQTVAGDLRDVDALASAMRGVESVFALTTPFESGPAAEIEQGTAIVAAAQRAGVPHLVFSSVASATAGTGVPHFETKAVIEAALGQSGVAHTIVAPTYFMDNALGAVQDLARGRLLLPMPVDQPLQQLARADLGRFVTAVLAEPSRFTGRRIELASDAPTPAQMADAFSEALGRRVVAGELPFDEDATGDMPAMWRFLRGHGYAVDVAALHAEGVLPRWTSFAQWARSVAAVPGVTSTGS
ncbi:NmrA/HSCARG family protein [Kineococcus sp. SYSU DK005]|uniref:NmrA/HSCARG family protein n=1 Tax=Kineococcus sp. SYSU DK005 TaxID=3383126 RepID=UPI003D7E2EDD